MSSPFRVVFKPFSGTFDFEKIPEPSGGLGGAGVSNGELSLPAGVNLELTGGLSMTGNGEVNLAAGSEILVLP